MGVGSSAAWAAFWAWCRLELCVWAEVALLGCVLLFLAAFAFLPACSSAGSSGACICHGSSARITWATSVVWGPALALMVGLDGLGAASARGWAASWTSTGASHHRAGWGRSRRGSLASGDLYGCMAASASKLVLGVRVRRGRRWCWAGSPSTSWLLGRVGCGRRLSGGPGARVIADGRRLSGSTRGITGMDRRWDHTAGEAGWAG